MLRTRHLSTESGEPKAGNSTVSEDVKLKKSPVKSSSAPNPACLHVDAAYHFTDRSNLASILQRGLLSGRRMAWSGYEHRPSSNDLSRELDRKLDLDDFIRLCLQPSHPMAYVARQRGSTNEIVWLEVSLHDLHSRRFDIHYSNTNATAGKAVVNTDPQTALKGDEQAEVLVRGHIPKRLISIFKEE